MKNCWTLDKSMASLSTCHVGILLWMAILLNLVKCLKKYVCKMLLDLVRTCSQHSSAGRHQSPVDAASPSAGLAGATPQPPAECSRRCEPVRLLHVPCAAHLPPHLCTTRLQAPWMVHVQILWRRETYARYRWMTGGE